MMTTMFKVQNLELLLCNATPITQYFSQIELGLLIQYTITLKYSEPSIQAFEWGFKALFKKVKDDLVNVCIVPVSVDV